MIRPVNYFVDVQSAEGCTTPGATVTFDFLGQSAPGFGTLPAVAGTGILLNLTFGAPAPAVSVPAATEGAASAAILAPPAVPPSSPPASAASDVAYPPGWNLVSAPSGSVIVRAQGSLFTLQPGDGGYEVLPSGQGVRAGLGYWAYFGAVTSVALTAGGNAPYQVTPAPGQWVMIGDPSAIQPAAVTGADAVYTYDPVHGYQQVTTLQPGQGAFAVSSSGATITLSPGASTGFTGPASQIAAGAPALPSADSAARHVVILVQGIDSQGIDPTKITNCGTFASQASQLDRTFDPQLQAVVTGPNGFAARWGYVSGKLDQIPGLSYTILGFSYGSQALPYYDPETCRQETAAQVGGRSAWPVYAASDTCEGVQAAAQQLQSLVRGALNADPNAVVDLVAHSMGGLVAAYYAATNPADLARLHSIVLLDSPLQGTLRNPTSGCGAGTQSWEDMATGSAVLHTVANAACASPPALPSSYTVESSAIGSPLSCGSPPTEVSGSTATVLAVGGGTAVGFAVGGLASAACGPPALFCLVGGAVLGNLGGQAVSDVSYHSAVWYDPVALDVVAAAVSNSTIFYGTITYQNGQAASGGTIVAAVNGISCGAGKVDGQGDYLVGVLPAPGCTTPGVMATFSVNGIPTNESATLPVTAGTVLQLSLSVGAGSGGSP